MKNAIISRRNTHTHKKREHPETLSIFIFPVRICEKWKTFSKFSRRNLIYFFIPGDLMKATAPTTSGRFPRTRFLNTQTRNVPKQIKRIWVAKQWRDVTGFGANTRNVDTLLYGVGVYPKYAEITLSSRWGCPAYMGFCDYFCVYVVLGMFEFMGFSCGLVILMYLFVN